MPSCGTGRRKDQILFAALMADPIQRMLDFFVGNDPVSEMMFSWKIHDRESKHHGQDPLARKHQHGNASEQQAATDADTENKGYHRKDGMAFMALNNLLVMTNKIIRPHTQNQQGKNEQAAKKGEQGDKPQHLQKISKGERGQFSDHAAFEVIALLS